MFPNTLWWASGKCVGSFYVLQDQDQDRLLVKRRNENHSPGPVIRESIAHTRGVNLATQSCGT